MSEQPGYGPTQIVRGLSLPRTIGRVAAGIGGLAMAGVIGVLWATEPTEPPLRTQAAFAALVAIGAGWAGLSALTIARRPMFALDRVIAGWLAVASSAVMTPGLIMLALNRGSAVAAVAGAAVGFCALGGAVRLLSRARSYRRQLTARHQELAEPGSHTPLPIGPLAIAMRHSGSGKAVAAAVVLLAAVLAGVALLLR